MGDPIPAPGTTPVPGGKAIVPIGPGAKLSWTMAFNTLALIYAALEQAGVVSMLPPPAQIAVVTIGNLLIRIMRGSPLTLFG